MELIKPGTKINFVGFRRYAYAFSLILILIGVISLIAKGGPRYGVDFAGGTLIQVKFKAPTTPEAIREGMKALDMTEATIQTFGAADQNEFLIRIHQEIEKLEGLSQRVQKSLEEKFGPGKLEVRRVETVGPKVGQDLRQKALLAIFYSLLFLAVYISGRFEQKWIMSGIVAGAIMITAYAATLLGAGLGWLILVAGVITLIVWFVFKLKYALGAIVALIHDVTITLGVFSLLNKEIDLTIVAALLTIIGYSMNDTIIVFDRIRETLRKTKKTSFDQVINASINETLSRTVITSGVTMLAVLPLYILGGPVISDFSLAMMVGIFVGTYSSIYVASPILLIWPPETGKETASIMVKQLFKPAVKNQGKVPAKAVARGKKKT
ncbi:MAG: protein translocase subunit SecF [Thermodesulfobacteriota bacterium]